MRKPADIVHVPPTWEPPGDPSPRHLRPGGQVRIRQMVIDETDTIDDYVSKALSMKRGLSRRLTVLSSSLPPVAQSPTTGEHPAARLYTDQDPV